MGKTFPMEVDRLLANISHEMWCSLLDALDEVDSAVGWRAPFEGLADFVYTYCGAAPGMV